MYLLNPIVRTAPVVILLQFSSLPFIQALNKFFVCTYNIIKLPYFSVSTSKIQHKSPPARLNHFHHKIDALHSNCHLRTGPCIQPR